MNNIKLFEKLLTPDNRVFIQQYIQTGDKRQDLRVNVPRMKELLRELFSNDISEFNVFTSISEKAFRWLFENQSVPKVNHVDSLVYIPQSYLDKPLLLIDAAAEVQPHQLKENMYLITFQIPYKLDWNEETFIYHPNCLLPNQLSYHHETDNECDS